MQGPLLAAGLSGAHLITSAIEHPAILACCRQLERQGVAVTRLPVDGEGLVDPADLERAIRPETRLVSIMAANNVIGTIQPIGELAHIAHSRGVLFHTDAVQAVGKIAFDMRAQPIDLLSLSGHKLHGPKGVGALYVRHGVELWPLLPGGGQERGRRSGTENVAAIAGLGRAAELAAADRPDEAARLVRIRDHLIENIRERIENCYLIGHRWRRLPGHICLGFDGLEGEAIKLLLELDKQGIAISVGQRVQRDPRRATLPRVGGPGIRRSQGPRLVKNIAGAVQYARRSRPVPGGVAPGCCFAAAHPAIGKGRMTLTVPKQGQGGLSWCKQ